MPSPIRTALMFFLVFGLWAGSSLWAENSEHIVKSGDTIYAISRQYGVSVAEIEKANKLGKDLQIKVGQRLKIPGVKSSSTPEVVPTATPQAIVEPKTSVDTLTATWTVRKGDTLYSIARETKIELAELLTANKLTRNSTLKIGQVLQLPGKVVAVATLAPSSTPSPEPAQVSPSAIPDKTTVPEKTTIPTISPEKTLNPVVSPSPAPVIVPSASPVATATSTEQASEGTFLHRVPYNQGSKLSWPHPGARFGINGKLPGILIAATKGDAVKAVTSGRVVYSGPHSSLGYIVFIQSASGFIYICGGNEDSALKSGDIVKTGDIIGTVGLAPGIQESQVYFSTWKDGTYVDPSSAPRE